MNNIKKQAEELSNRPYSVVVFRDKATDNEYIYVAVNPELEGCIAQGESMREAQENLKLFRVDYIQHLLENNLPVPDPAWMATRTEDKGQKIVLPSVESEPSFENVLTQVVQPKYRKELFDFQLKVEYGSVQHG